MAAKIYARIGAEIRRQREGLGMTQAQLASRINAGRTSIAMMERGGQALLVHQLIDLATALRTTPAEILSGALADQNEEVAVTPSDRKMKSLLRDLNQSISRITRK
jgi:transcriptional regulator with XRE-family HTH domain